MPRPIAQIIADSMEPTEAQDTILKLLKEHEDKQLGKRVIDKLNEATDNRYKLRLSASGGMLHIAWGDHNYHQTGKIGGELLIAHQLKNVTIRTADIEAKNPCYYSACKERNAVRERLLQNKKQVIEAQQIIDTLTTTIKAAKQLFKFGNPLNVISPEVGREYGLYREHSGSILN